ncbi:MAG: VWA domain-containing protein, partial [Planctomycetaceae bacterium]
SDGITSTTDADRLSAAAELAQGKGVPVFAVAIGSEEPARDVQLYDLLVDDVAFVDDPIAFTAKVKSYGYEGRMLSVQLRRKGSSEVLESKRLRAREDGQPQDVELAYASQTDGEFDFVIEAVPFADETSKENNAEVRHVSVRSEKIRVLLVESGPRWEWRFLKNLLEREKTVELTTILQEADLEFAAEDETVADHFPVKKDELLEYDVVILGDVDPEFLSPVVFENLRDFVRDAGGGLVFIAGTQHNPTAYRGTALEPMLPIELADARRPPADATITESFQPELTIDARKGTSIFRFAESEADSLAIWRGLPGMYWLFEAPKLKAGAIVFAQHPTRYGDDGKLPVIVMQRYGAGKVLFHAVEELWLWRFRAGDLFFGRYWIQTIRYLSRAKLLGTDRTAELVSDRKIYQQGDPVHLRVRFFNEKLSPVEDDGVQAMVERRGQTARSVTLKRLPQAPTVFEGTLTGATEGAYHAWVAEPSFKEAPPSVDFRVEAPLAELQNRSLDRADLQKTVQTTGGRLYTLENAHRLPAELPAGPTVALETQPPIPLWNRPELLLLFALLFLAEWLLRKRYRLV